MEGTPTITTTSELLPASLVTHGLTRVNLGERRNGSYYQKDADGSTYYDTGRGYSQKTSPSGQTTKSYGKN
jgi:hypothetical protein